MGTRRMSSSQICLGSSPQRSPSLSSGKQGGGLGLVFVLEAKEPESSAGETGNGRALRSAGAGRSAVTLMRMPSSGRSVSALGHPLLAGQADSVRKRAMMSPIVLPRSERQPRRRKGVGWARGSQASVGRPEHAGSGRKWGHPGGWAKGLAGEVRAPPRPSSTAWAAGPAGGQGRASLRGQPHLWRAPP